MGTIRRVATRKGSALTMPTAQRFPQRGEIWWTNFHTDPPEKGRRPVIIVSPNARNQHARAVFRCNCELRQLRWVTVVERLAAVLRRLWGLLWVPLL